MARIRVPGFVGPSYTSESRIAAYDRTVNLIPEKIESGTGQAEYVLYLPPGYSTFCTLPDTPVRGLYTLNGTTWAVGGESLYQLPLVAGDAPTLLTTGVSNPDDGWVTIAGNGDAGHQLLLASGSYKFCFDIPSNTLTAQTGLAQQVGFLNGYGIALDTARSEVSVSALEDFSSWDAGDVAQRNDAADKWVAMLVHQSGRELYLFGNQTTVPYYLDPNATANAFPFVPNPSVFITQGTSSPNSPAVLKGSPIWLGQGIGGGNVVYWLNGYTPTRVSTHPVEDAFAVYSQAQVQAARGVVYEENGHAFYVLTFPPINTYGEPVLAGATWVFDATTGFWHERGEWNGWDYDALPIIGHVYANGMHLVGSPDSGVIYQQSKTLLTSTSGDGIRWLRRAPHIASLHQRMIVDRFELLMEVGLGLPSGQGSDPQVTLQWSNNGGETWNPEQSVSAGAVGAFSTRAVWRQLGLSRDRVFQLTGSDPIPWRLIDAFVDVRVGPA